MKNFIILLLTLFFVCSCAVNEEPPEQFIPKEEVAPLWGCKEMRKENQEADC